MDYIKSLYQPKKDTVEALIATQKALLLHQDASENPLNGQPRLDALSLSIQVIETKYLDQAIELIQKDLEKVKVKDLDVHYDYEYMPKTENQPGKFVLMSKATKNEKDQVYQAQFREFQKEMKVLATSAIKQEKKLGVLLGGYMVRSKTLKNSLLAQWDAYSQAYEEYQTFSEMYKNEQKIIEGRIYNSNKWVERLALTEQDLQDRYRQLVEQKENIQV